MTTPCALLFANGNAAYFDAKGNQLPNFQRLGWCGLRTYLEHYPDAVVRLQGGEVDPDLLPWLLRHLRDEPGARPNL